LLLGQETQEALLDVLKDPGASADLRAEIASVLGMTTAPDIVAEYAQKMSAYGLAGNRPAPLFPEQLAISLRALGGLLAGGRWNAQKLEELRDVSKDGTPAHELFNVLLGFRYEPLFADLQSTMEAEQEAHEKEVRTLSARIIADQQRIQALDNELSLVEREHGFRGDELEQVVHDNQRLQYNLEQITKERAVFHDRLEQLIQEKEALDDNLEQMSQEINRLNARLEQALEQNRVLSDQNERLIRQIN
jgi:hypothetical protein